MFPPMEMDEHREEREKLEKRIAELEKQLSDYAKTTKKHNSDGQLDSLL
jgi:BMFP domain-containing protein YqiC